MRWRLVLTAVLAILGGCHKDAPVVPTPVPQAWQRPPVIDYHTHLSLDGLDRIARIMTENGIEAMVNLSGGSFRRGPSAWLEAKMLSDKLGGHVWNYMNPDWTGYGAADWGNREAGRLQDAVDHYGFRGLKISKALGLGVTDEADKLVPVDDPGMGPLWCKCADLGIPVSIHVADPRAFWEPLTPQNERWDELHAHPFWAYGWIPEDMRAKIAQAEGPGGRPPVPPWGAMLQAAERMYRQNPRTTFVAVHFGNAAEDIAYVDGLLTRNPNVWIDVSARLGEFGRHPAAEVRSFFLKWQDRIVFGTDLGVGADYLMLGSNGEVEPGLADVKPFYDAHWRYFETAGKQIAHPSPIQGNWKIDAIGLPPEVLQKMYRGNALRILDRQALRDFAAKAPPSPSAPITVPAPAAAPVAAAPTVAPLPAH
jgi:predicted TIM-barrel fold metal-dependent hydrolase